jgi:hypothetical protein
MSDHAPRRFTLLDAMLLVAAAALVMVSAGPHLRDVPWSLDPMGPWDVNVHRVQIISEPSLSMSIWHGNMALIDTAVILSAAYFTPRLLRPRPPLASLLRRPGFQACTAAIASFVLLVVTDFAYARVVPRAVLATWAGTALKGRWCPEPSWIDRFGRAIGFSWILPAVPLFWSEWLDRHR